MRRHELGFFCLVMSIGLSNAAMARQCFVSPTGKDQADGGKNQPWKNLGRAAPALGTGDELIVAGGEYHTGFTLSGLKGTEDNPVIIRSVRHHRVLLKLSGTPLQGIRLKDCAYVVIRGFEVVGTAEGSGIELYNCHHCTIEGNVVHSGKGQGIRLHTSTDNVLRGNICYHNDTGIYIGSESTRNRIEANVCAFGNRTSENADGIGSSDSLENTYRFNVLVCNNDDGLDMWTSKRNTIEWNLACANGDQKAGDGNGFKLGGKWRNRGKDDTWNGGENVVRNNLSMWNMSTGFTDNGSSGNRYEGNVAFGNLNTSSYASVKHTGSDQAERIRVKLRERFKMLISEEVIRPTVNPLPLGVGLIRELKIWPTDVGGMNHERKSDRETH